MQRECWQPLLQPSFLAGLQLRLDTLRQGAGFTGSSSQMLRQYLQHGLPGMPANDGGERRDMLMANDLIYADARRRVFSQACCVLPGGTESQFCCFLALEDVPPAALLIDALARARQSQPTDHARLENVLPALAALLPDAGPAAFSIARHGS